MTFVRAVSSQETHRSILKVLENVAVLLKAAKPMIMGKTFSFWLPTVISSSSTAGIDEVVKRFLIDASQKAERDVPGSGELSLLLTTMLSIDVEKRRFFADNLNEILQDDLRAFEIAWPMFCKDVSNEFIRDQVSLLASHSTIKMMINRALDLAGANCMIEIDRELSPFSTVSVIDGFLFPINAYPEFLRGKPWIRNDVAIALIDGFVEKVSEINELLVAACETKQPLVIAARGFAEEVVATVILNANRGTLDVALLRAPFDLKTANILNDIGVVVNSDVLSALKGEIIEKLNFSSLPHVETVKIDEHGTTIISKSLFLDDHIRKLEKQSKEMSSDAKELIDERIRRLAAKRVKISLDKELFPFIANFDLILTTIRGYLLGGKFVVTNNDFSNNLYFESIRKLGKENFEEVPAVFLMSAVKRACSAALALNSIETSILVER